MERHAEFISAFNKWVRYESKIEDPDSEPSSG